MTKLRWGLIGASTIAAEHMIGAFRANGGEGVASAAGEDGIKSLSVAISALAATRSGAETPIDLTG
jgi:predicted dehydrogenase